MSKRLSALAALLLHALAIGCDVPCSSLDPSSASLELGTGESEFQVLDDGQTLGAVWGPQGGSHIWGALRAEGIMRGPGPNIFETSEDNPLIEFRVGHADGAIATWGPMHFAVDYLANQGGALNGVTVFVETGRTEAPWLWPDEWMEQGVPLELPAEDSAEFEQAIAAAEADIAARTFTMEVWITDACGTALHDSKSIRLDASTIEAWP